VLTERVAGDDVDDRKSWNEQSLTSEDAPNWAQKILRDEGRPEVEWIRANTPFGERWTATLEDENA
jgi:hypothetical protein